MRKALLLFLIFTMALLAVAEKAPSADKMISEARARAKAEQKTILLIFGASWCAGCDVLDSFLKNPQTQAVFDKHFVVVHLNVFEEAGEHPGNNTPGGDKWIIKFGGVSPAGEVSLPFMVVLDADGKRLIDSRRTPDRNSKDTNIGFPSEPVEVDWFLRMLKQGAPNLTDEESQQISTMLQQASG